MRLAEVWMDEYKRLFYGHRRDLLVSIYELFRYYKFSLCMTMKIRLTM